jgi:exonuclease III
MNGVPPHPPPPPPVYSLLALNNAADLDFMYNYNSILGDFDDNNFEPYLNVDINSKFYDMYNLPSILNDESSPIFLSINIQSLKSKHSELRNQIIELTSKNLKIDVIAIQETWDVCQPDLLAIPGYQTFICKNRVNMRGGGVGFYVKNGINFKIIDTLSPFEQKIFESLTIQISYNDKSILLTSAYRSNGALPNMTTNQQLEVFQAMFGELLHNLNNRRLPSYVFIDSNIDLLNLHSEQSKNYLNILQLTMKCTRFQNQSRTLIDQILTSSKCNSFQTGTVISDISDHFFTFIRPPPCNGKIQRKNHLLSQLLPTKP